MWRLFLQEGSWPESRLVVGFEDMHVETGLTMWDVARFRNPFLAQKSWQRSALTAQIHTLSEPNIVTWNDVF